MKTLTALAALSLLFAGVAPAHGNAEPPMCQGKPATVVGDPDRPREAVDGTEGDDVIVSNGQQFVFGYGGDDTICVTGDRPTRVGAEEGDDVVDASALATSAKAWVALGRGDDTFVGHRGVDQIYTDRDLPPGSSADVGTDVVSTGGGADIVESGVRRFADDDRIDLGDGDDYLRLRGPSTGMLIGGSGRDEVRFSWAPGPRQWTFDNVEGRVTHAGAVVARISGLELFDLRALGNADLDVLGGDRAETVRVGRSSGTQTGRFKATMGDGDDSLSVSSSQQLDLVGGAGRDRVVYWNDSSKHSTVTLDLRAGTVTRKGAVVARTAGFEDAVLGSPPGSHLVGTAGDNVLTLRSCRGRIDGLDGDDRLSTATTGLTCNDSVLGVQLYGGPGDDWLRGGAYRDRLHGGPGSDVADGGRRSDLCRAERRTSCERT